MADYVVLDRIESNMKPPYCIHGRATCIACRKWCWMGNETSKIVQSGQAEPLCLTCARRHLKPESITGHIKDHRRADGLHD